MESKQFMVRVFCRTFNQAAYIEKTFDGFSMQKTDFPYYCIIVDDASTDGEQEVIRKYLSNHFDLDNRNNARIEETEDYNFVYAQHYDNKNCYFIVYLLKYNHYSIKKRVKPYLEEWQEQNKYTAICEGDDYWSKPNKLQKQVDFLETHDNVNICVHNADKYICSTGETIPFNASYKSGIYTIKDVIRMKWFTPTASFLYRNNIQVSPLWAKNGCNGDMAILYTNLLKGDLYYDSEIMSVYRYGTPSSMSSSSNDRVIVQKKINLYKTINEVTNNKYLLYTTSQIIKLKIMQWQLFRIVNSLRIKVRLKLLGNTKKLFKNG